MLIDEKILTQTLVQKSIDNLIAYFNSSETTSLTNGDLEYAVMILKGLLMNYETITLA